MFGLKELDFSCGTTRTGVTWLGSRGEVSDFPSSTRGSNVSGFEFRMGEKSIFSSTGESTGEAVLLSEAGLGSLASRVFAGVLLTVGIRDEFGEFSAGHFLPCFAVGDSWSAFTIRLSEFFSSGASEGDALVLTLDGLSKIDGPPGTAYNRRLCFFS
eukprot:759185-Amorphochlora_amoeboformis.AAC.1